MTGLPETILQFGSGRFLRAFADLFIHHANQSGQNVGRVVIVQSTGAQRAGALSADARQELRLTLWIVHGTAERRLCRPRLQGEVRALLEQPENLSVDAIDLRADLCEPCRRIRGHVDASARSSAMSATARS